jgi:hypothetical protein
MNSVVIYRGNPVVIQHLNLRGYDGLVVWLWWWSKGKGKKFLCATTWKTSSCMITNDMEG